MGTFFILLVIAAAVWAWTKLRPKKNTWTPQAPARSDTSDSVDINAFMERWDREMDKRALPAPIVVNVHGAAPFEYADSHKDDLEIMIACTKAELLAAQQSGYLQAPAPFFFERVAILARKQKNYALEVGICEVLLDHMGKWKNAVRERGLSPGRDIANTAAGPVVSRISERLPKARALLEKSKK